MLSRQPALRFLIAFSLGILCAHWFSIGTLWIYWLIILIIFTILTITLFHKSKIVGYLLQVSIILIGFLLQSINKYDFANKKIVPNKQNENIKIFGTIDSELIIQENKISFVVKADSIKRIFNVDTREQRILIVAHYKNVPIIKKTDFGKKVFLDGILEPYPFQRNPGEFNYGRYLELNNIQGVARVNKIDDIVKNESTKNNNIQYYTFWAQQYLYKIIDGLHTSQHASFLKGIIFGYKAEIPLDIKQSFMDTGTIHILAVSGSNVAFVAFVFYTFFSFFRLPRKVIGLITILGLMFYMVITGSSPSVVRATIMAIVILVGTLLERKTDIYNSISVAAIIILLWDTNILFDVGFQLSFSAVISIVFLYPKLEKIINKIPEKYEEIKAIDFVLKLFAVSLAALIGTMPFTAYYFGRVSIISLIANIIVVPISGLNTFIGFTEILFSFFSNWIASFYGAVNDLLVWFLLGFVKKAASVPYAYVELHDINIIYWIGYFVLVFLMFSFNKSYKRKYALIIILIVSNILIYTSIFNSNTSKVCITMLDVGQGDAILAEFTNGKKMLIDAGPSFRKTDAGLKTIAPFLKRKGINKLDFLLITHPHNDHIGGVKSIIHSIQVDTLIIPGSKSKSSQLVNLLEQAIKINIGIKALQSNSQLYIDKSARIYILHPDSNYSLVNNQNNISIVLKVIYGETSALFVGDAEIQVENVLISKYGKFLESEILKIGHHGSKTSTSAKFLEVVNPNIALISVGNRNKFNHPSDIVLNRLFSDSIFVHRTDREGAVIYESCGKKWNFVNWRQM